MFQWSTAFDLSLSAERRGPPSQDNRKIYSVFM